MLITSTKAVLSSHLNYLLSCFTQDLKPCRATRIMWYKHWTDDDLIAEIGRRSLDIPGPRPGRTHPSRRACLRVLNAYDYEHPFQFMELPPEMRSTVYGHHLRAPSHLQPQRPTMSQSPPAQPRDQ